MTEVKREDGDQAKQLSGKVVQLPNKRFENKIPSVEKIQDIVEEILLRNGYIDVARAYIL